jgi:hypothetical protein
MAKKGVNFTQEHRDKISAALKEKWKTWKEQGGRKPKMSFFIYDVSKERATIVVDHDRRTLGIEIDNLLTISTGNHELEEMERLEEALTAKGFRRKIRRAETMEKKGGWGRKKSGK